MLVGGRSAQAWRTGPPADRVGACGFGPTCRDAGCHATYPLGSTTLAFDLHEEGPIPGPLPAAYVPGRTYRLRLDVTDTDPGAAIWGFELAPLLACPTPVAAGTMTPADPGRARAFSAGGINYLSHRCTCTIGDPTCCGYLPELAPGVIGWSFDWTAPPRGSGAVSFALAFNAANWDDTPSFDRISLGEAAVTEEACPPAVGDLRVTLERCDVGSPTERRVRLRWSPSGPGPQVIRTTDDPGLLGASPATWSLGASDCLPISGAPLELYSVSGTCELGSDGPH